MADIADLAQTAESQELHRLLSLARSNRPQESRLCCIDCEEEIPAARRKAVPGVQRCIFCQEKQEKDYVRK